MRLKIGLYPMGNESWFAGIVLLKNLLYALRHTYRDRVKFCLVARDANCSGLKNLQVQVDEVLLFPSFPIARRLTFPWFVNGIMRRVFPRRDKIKNEIREGHLLKQHGVDVLFGPAIIDQYRQIPTLSWIWDFQHLHLPEMFSPKERFDRDELFSKTAKRASRIIVISESIKRDFQKFLPKYADKVRVIQFTVYIPESVYKIDPKSALALYNLPEKFIYLPNQFWKHKNHEIVFRALKSLKEKETKVIMVCSGYPNDYRHPNYFAHLFQKLSEWNIREQVIYLGMIPYEHVLLLMRQSICVLNPSLFEGFGLTANEAKALGKQVLLSDIPAHRQQNPAKTIFFNPQNLEDLVEKMSKIWHQAHLGPDVELEEKARKEMPERIRACAQSFVSVVEEVVK